MHVHWMPTSDIQVHQDNSAEVDACINLKVKHALLWNLHYLQQDSDVHATKFELHLPSIILHALNLWFNSLSFNASSLSCLIINSEKESERHADNPTHCASADHNHINFGIRLPFTLH